MPELPEVETVRRTLDKLIGMRVIKIWTSGAHLRLKQTIDLGKLEEAALNRYVEGIRRRGKYLILDFSGGSISTLIHLGMSGRLRLLDAGATRETHTHVIWSLSHLNQMRELHYADPRRFGQVSAVTRGAEAEHPSLSALGMDPLLDNFTGDALYLSTRDCRRPIKAVLLDQRIVAGLGNIYASEVLWRVRLHPLTITSGINQRQANEVVAAIKYVLQRALENGGTTLRDFISADGRVGTNADYLSVYDRDGKVCLRRGCGSLIQRSLIQGRATYYCPGCQT